VIKAVAALFILIKCSDAMEMYPKINTLINNIVIDSAVLSYQDYKTVILILVLFILLRK
jgi:hypothetical protein